jgi:hypothetical protein
VIIAPAIAMCRSLFAILLWVISCATLHADGGRVLGEKQAGSYRVVLFADPTPLRAGLADLSLFLEDSGKGGPVLDAEVNFSLIKLSRPTPELAWKGIGCVTPGQAVPAAQGHSGNGLLYSAMLGIPEPGLWQLGVTISRAGRTDFVSFELPVDRALPPMLTWWPVVALMPLGILLYIWRGYILKKRRAL